VAGTQSPAIDEQGIVQTGKYAGYHISDVIGYAEALDAAAEKPQASGGGTPDRPTAATPAERLHRDAEGRVDNFAKIAAQRFEQEDEAEFRSSVSDYEKFKPAIDEMKKALQADARIQRGVHRMLYIYAKQADPEFQKRLFEPAAEEPTADEELSETPAPPDEPSEPEEEKVEELKPPRPKAVPSQATAKATPATRTAPQAVPPKPKLRASDKVLRYCKQMGLEPSTFLRSLEARGFTQDDLNQFNEGKRPSIGGGRKSVYDYSDE
jgi:hypothetical protein